jgi:hypothetical protein
MTETSVKTDVLNWEEPKKLPDMLNVLTILTFIGCGLGGIFNIYGFFNAQHTYDQVLQMQDKIDQLPGYIKNMMGSDPVGMAQKALDNRLPILLLNLAGVGVCLYGALQMRKLQKAGFGTYILGDILPYVSMFLFQGVTVGFGLYVGVLFTAIFVILYATQLKYMK